MADSYDPIDDALAAAFDDDAEAPGAPQAADSPSSDSTPDDADRGAADEAPVDEVADEAEAEIAADAEDDDAVGQAVAEPEIPAQAAEQTPVVDWDSPDNPYRQKAAELEPKAQRAEQFERVVQLAQERRAQELAAQRLRTLADDDPQRVTELQNFVQEQQQPVLRQVQSLEGEVETVAKAATVLDAAVRLYVPPELQAKIDAEVERLMRLPGGYSVLQNHIQTRQEATAEANATIAELQRQNALLTKKLNARAQVAQRQASGADVVDSGPGIGGSFADRWAAASTFDDAFDAIVADIPELAPAR